MNMLPDDNRSTWHIAGHWPTPGRRVICGRPIKTGGYAISNGAGRTLGPVGPTCVTPFCYGHDVADVADLCDLKRVSTELGPGEAMPVRLEDGGDFTTGSLRLLVQLGALDRRDDLPRDGLDSSVRYEILVRAACGRQPDGETLRAAREIVELRVRPWLGEWDGVA